MPRTAKLIEWFGKSDDHRAPGSVRLRVFDRESGKCHLCNLLITDRKWDLDHETALINGGENRESNLKPAHRSCHKKKTAADVAEKAKVAAVRAKHVGAAVPTTRPLQSRNTFSKPDKQRQPSKREPLPPKAIYAARDDQAKSILERNRA